MAKPSFLSGTRQARQGREDFFRHRSLQEVLAAGAYGRLLQAERGPDREESCRERRSSRQAPFGGVDNEINVIAPCSARAVRAEVLAMIAASGRDDHFGRRSWPDRRARVGSGREYTRKPKRPGRRRARRLIVAATGNAVRWSIAGPRSPKRSARRGDLRHARARRSSTDHRHRRKAAKGPWDVAVSATRGQGNSRTSEARTSRGYS